METNHPFVGRQKELTALKEMVQRGKSQICVVYGRRRVGKTELIRHAFQGHRFYSFEGIENQGKSEQIDNFLFQLDYQIKKKTRRKTSCHSWREAFSQLVSLAQEGPVVILLDELQWMANYHSDLVSDLKMIWDQLLSRAGPVTLVLCGSIASFMQKKVIKSKALYGRTDLTIHLKPFSIQETTELLEGKGHEEILLVHLLVGGIPKYLNLLKEEGSVLLGINKLAFQTAGYFFDEFDRIFTSHFGHHEKYEQIIKTLAGHPYGKSRHEMISTTDSTGGGELTRVLYNLESAGFISSFVPFDKNQNSRLKRYYISDPFLSFYFAFILPYKLGQPKQENYFLNHICPKPQFSSWLGRSFELFCLNHCHDIAKILGFSAVDYQAGPYFNHSKKGQLSGVQIDLIFDRADKVITVCEIKYQNSAIGMNVIRELQGKIEKIEELQNKTVQKVLISKSQASPEVLKSGYFSRVILAEEFFFRTQ